MASAAAGASEAEEAGLLLTNRQGLPPQGAQPWWRRLFPAGRNNNNAEQVGLLPTNQQGLPPQGAQPWWKRLFPAGHNNNNDEGPNCLGRAAACLRSVIPLSRWCSLTNLGFADFLEAMATLAVMAILTLNIYSATYFLAWAESESVCLDMKNTELSPTFKHLLKIIIVSLPFAVCPVTLYISGNVKAAQKERRGLGYAAVLVISEIIYVFILGALMTVCMSEASVSSVILVTAGIVVAVFVLWGCWCHHPKLLRCVMFPSCCCPELDVEVALPEGQANP